MPGKINQFGASKSAMILAELLDKPENRKYRKLKRFFGELGEGYHLLDELWQVPVTLGLKTDPGQARWRRSQAVFRLMGCMFRQQEARLQLICGVGPATLDSDFHEVYRETAGLDEGPFDHGPP